MRDQAQNLRTCITQLNAMNSKMEAMDDQKEVYDSLMCWRDDKRAENYKLMALNELIVEAEEDISRKETHIKILDAAISSEKQKRARMMPNTLPSNRALRSLSFPGVYDGYVDGASPIKLLHMTFLLLKASNENFPKYAYVPLSLIPPNGYEMIEACQDMIAFVRELESIAGVIVMAKTVMFFKEMMDKEGSREWQLHDLGKEAKERALENELFV
uniref:Uncharacterized protein n=1 Tax=Tanacetum cinerariifolium TaxID=118510 RepID=A0A6L2NJQ9_TANCI|nr:hypothetical protein [Tanacetum cinerariifolium]